MPFLTHQHNHVREWGGGGSIISQDVALSTAATGEFQNPNAARTGRKRTAAMARCATAGAVAVPMATPSTLVPQSYGITIGLGFTRQGLPESRIPAQCAAGEAKRPHHLPFAACAGIRFPVPAGVGGNRRRAIPPGAVSLPALLNPPTPAGRPAYATGRLAVPTGPSHTGNGSTGKTGRTLYASPVATCRNPTARLRHRD